MIKTRFPIPQIMQSDMKERYEDFLRDQRENPKADSHPTVPTYRIGRWLAKMMRKSNLPRTAMLHPTDKNRKILTFDVGNGVNLSSTYVNATETKKALDIPSFMVNMNTMEIIVYEKQRQ